ncbi:DUF3014 domain-containing protein [Porticoccus sp. W117]|uniref:DUF3014 domain-containing protein n=1 Tax=Porticoccus sp. W117 TaxID=3054777 RepID=UPI002593B4BD|nr:DUF3014 domain-containing protein [Porticoccus sp. W117]MDM3871971.1 DUF3014 domain-containing protein [Porticoccus sp. W117]
MTPAPDERNEQSYYYPSDKPRNRGTQAIILVIAIGVLALGGWWASRTPEPAPEPVTEAPEPMVEQAEQIIPKKVATPEVEPEPTPPTVVETPVEVPQPEPVQLPNLDNSDSFVREALAQLGEGTINNKWLQTDNLVRRATAVTDGISRGQLLQKFLPVSAPSGKFVADKQGQTLTLSTQNYRRYDSLVNELVAVEPEQMAQALKQLQPLMEQAFGEQGYPDRTYEGTLLEAIDQLLSTPSFEEPPELVLESVHYSFKDKNLEALSQVQKQLIRSGPENTRKLQAYLQQLKDELGK